jgi:uncharacterized protein YdcH (DUF465 family)
MAEQLDEIKKRLSSNDQEFRQWLQQHHQYEDRLAELAHKPSLTSEEEIEEKLLKKKKLFLKDQMAAKIRNYEAAHSA